MSWPCAHDGLSAVKRGFRGALVAPRCCCCSRTPRQIIPGDFWISKPHLRINPTESELGTGYASLALFAVYLVAFGVLAVLEIMRPNDSKRSKSHSLPFLLSVVGFCLLRLIQIAVALNVSRLYPNMATELVLYCLGCILFLLAFTFIAMTWTSVLRK